MKHLEEAQVELSDNILPSQKTSHIPHALIWPCTQVHEVERRQRIRPPLGSRWLEGTRTDFRLSSGYLATCTKKDSTPRRPPPHSHFYYHPFVEESQVADTIDLLDVLEAPIAKVKYFSFTPSSSSRTTPHDVGFPEHM